MNIVQLQDMLRGMPDDRLQSEMQQPSGSIPQYLVLSEIVRRDKARSSAAEMPKTTVVEDMMNQAQMAGGIGSLAGQAPMAPEEGMQEAAPMYADGGFISPADAMGRAGVAGYPQPPQKQPFQLSASPQGGGTMFTPNTNPAPAPQTNFNLTQQPASDNGVQQNANIPSFMQQQNEYSNGYADGGVIGLKEGGMSNELALLIKREADRLGIDPVDLATTISYETAGTFSPTIKGKARTKWGTHIGLIQMGDPQREQYGYDPSGSLSDQMRAVGDYLADRGVKPGMGLLDVYSTVNAGAPGRYNRSDEKVGGAPGTVADKVRDQMAGHREKAVNLLRNVSEPPAESMPGPVVAQNTPAPVAMAGRETTAGLGEGAGLAAVGRPVAMAGRETPAGLGEGAGKAAIGDTTMVADRADKGFLSGIRSLFGSEEQRKKIGAGMRDIGTSMAEGSQAPEPPDAPMKSADISGLERLRSSPEEELAQYAALRQQYISGAYADGGYLSALGAGLRDMGSSMAQGQDAPEAPDAPMKSSDVSGLDRLRSSPESDLAQYAALRKSYMTDGYAEGGAIRMRDGTPEKSAEELRKEYEALPDWKKALWTLDDAARVAVGSGLGGDWLAAKMNSLVGPETFEEELAAQEAPTKEARQRLGGYSFIPEYLVPGGVAVKGLKYGIPALKYAVTNPTARSLLTRAGLVGGTGYLLAGGEPSEPTTPAEPAPEFGYNPAGDTMLPGAKEAAEVYNLDPKLKDRILRQRGPLEGDARTPEEAEAIAANSAPSPYQLLAGSQERQQKMLQDYYDSLIQLEKDRMTESQGFGAFLKELGRGMLSNTSAFGPSVAAGAARAIGSREDTSAAARGKMSELELAKKKAQIEGIAALDKLRYEQLVGNPLSSREQAQYLIPQLMKMADDYKDTNPDLAEAYRKQATEMMRAMGINIETPTVAPPVEEKSWFDTIIGK